MKKVKENYIVPLVIGFAAIILLSGCQRTSDSASDPNESIITSNGQKSNPSYESSALLGQEEGSGSSDTVTVHTTTSDEGSGSGSNDTTSDVGSGSSSTDNSSNGTGNDEGSGSGGSGDQGSSSGAGTSGPVIDHGTVAPFTFIQDANNRTLVKFKCDDSTNHIDPTCGQVKEVGFCLNCIGAKSPDISDLFNNIGETILSCPSYDLPEDFGVKLFHGGELIPITSISQYNPNKLQDAALTAKFNGLCPFATEEPIVLGVVDRLTRAVVQVPLVLCGNKIYPLTTPTVRCDQSAEAVINYVEKNLSAIRTVEEKYQYNLENSELVKISYNVMPLSDFMEGQYLQCDKDSEAICQKICNSKRSCLIPLNSEKNVKSILNFDSGKFKVCEGREIKLETFLRLIQDDSIFVFSHRSLNLQYEGIPNSNDFHDFSVINGILTDFNGIFQADRDWKDEEYRTFLFSSAYRNKIKTKLEAFCRSNETAYLMGHDGQAELALCQSESDLRILVLAKSGEDCENAGRKLGAYGPIIERTGH